MYFQLEGAEDTYAFGRMLKPVYCRTYTDFSSSFRSLLNNLVPTNRYSTYSEQRNEEKEMPQGQGGGGGFNWGILIGAAGTAIFAGTEYADNLVRTSFKTGRNPVSWSKLTPKQQAWRTANVLGKNAKYIKYAKVAGVVGTGISVGMAGRDIYKGEGTTIDYFDVGVGTTSIGVAIFLASNPVGWVIGAGAAVYFGGRLVYDIYEEVND